MHRIAIIDLGTNTFHLLIADIDASNVQVLHKDKQSVKIGEGGISQGEITIVAQERALHTLQGFKKKITTMEVRQIFATATSAFRNTSNGKGLAEEILNQTGIEINIIDGQQEAQLIYQGVRQALDLGSSYSLIMDIGGGSVEFIIGNHTNIKWSHSFEIGAQRLMDQFHHHDPISGQEIESLESFLDVQLASLVPAMEQYHPSRLIGASGTFDTLSNIHCIVQGLEKTDDSEQPLSIAGFRVIHNEIKVKNRAERLKIPGMIEMRVDMIVVASCLIDYILDRFSLSNISVSSYALKEGALFDVCSEVRAQLG